MRPYIVYWNNIPSPYMVDRFNALADRGGFEFEAWFNDRIEADRSWEVDEASWRFQYRYLPITHLFGHTQHWPLPLFGRRPDVMVSLYAEPAFICGWAIAKLRGVKTAFRVLMTHDRWITRHPFKEALKRFLFRRVDAIETPGEDGKAFAMRYGVPAERIFFATHTVDTRSFDAATSAVRPEREAFCRELGLEGTTFLYVGRLWWGKGVNYLLDAFEHIQHQCAEPVSLLLVGDGPEEARLRQTCIERGIHNVVFAGFQQIRDLPRYYALADVFVFPTLGDPYGLVVDEAMTCGLPVISTSSAGEIRARITEGHNGYIVPPEDVNALAESMLKLARHPDMRERMGMASAEKVQGHAPEKWAEDFERIVSYLLTAGKACDDGL